jgi:predicted enzyme related to lactoylglutathione lyase
MRDRRGQQSGRLVHLELHTHHLCGASRFYRDLLGWPTERIDCESGSYYALAFGGPLDGGIVECGARRPIWLPYVEVTEINAMTERGRELGAAVLLEPREGPAGWRSVLAPGDGGEVALWQRKRIPGRRLG